MKDVPGLTISQNLIEENKQSYLLYLINFILTKKKCEIHVAENKTRYDGQWNAEM